MTTTVDRGYRWGRARVDVPHWVYTYYNDNEPVPERRVLYIGFTNNMPNRNMGHRHKWWHNQATRVLLVEYPDRQSAFEAEGRAISRHCPIGNLNNNSRRIEVHREYLEAKSAAQWALYEQWLAKLPRASA